MDDMTEVVVHIYDLSAGLASVLSQSVLGKQLEGIWHTGIVTYGREYFFGSCGIQNCAPGGTILGDPIRVEKLGNTEVPYQLFLEYILGLGESSFAPSSYSLLQHNCNNFADELSTFLCGRGLPKYILTLPDEILNTPLGQTIGPLLAGLSLKPNVAPSNGDPRNLQFLSSPPGGRRSNSPDLDELNKQVDDIREDSKRLAAQRTTLNEKVLKLERKKLRKEEKRHKKEQRRREKLEAVQDTDRDSSGSRRSGDGEEQKSDKSDVTPSSANQKPMADEPRPPPAGADQPDDGELAKPRVPPITFKEAVKDVVSEFDGLEKLAGTNLSEPERQNLSELRQYLIDGEGAWALGENFINFLGRILHDKSLPPTARVHLLNLLSVATLRDDFILILHQDRREHILMNYAEDVDRLPEEEQTALSLAFANMFEQNSSSEWLLYISEWQSPNTNSAVSNIRITTKVAVNAILADSSVLQERGAAIMYNLAVKEKFKTNLSVRQSMPAGSLNRVFDDVATELAMAVLQYFQTTPAEELVFRCMTALSRFAQVSYNDVPQLIKMIGPEPNKFLGLSSRVDSLIGDLENRMSRVQI